jgi:hypothetical protein
MQDRISVNTDHNCLKVQASHFVDIKGCSWATALWDRIKQRLPDPSMGFDNWIVAWIKPISIVAINDW